MDNNISAVFGRMSGMHGLTDSSLKHLVAWGDHLKVDQPHIDAQHEGIFKLAMEIADQWFKHGDLDRIKGLAEKLAKVLEGHFLYEELQLAEVGYPKLEEHKSEHTVMLEELQVIRDRLDNMGHGTAHKLPGFIINNFILGVTVGHIGCSDMEYCAFARKAAEGKEQVWPAS
jgi:hemerythrin